jgi:hypothetical protein
MSRPRARRTLIAVALIAPLPMSFLSAMVYCLGWRDALTTVALFAALMASIMLFLIGMQMLTVDE